MNIKEEFLRDFQERMREIDRKSLALTSAVAKNNIYSIMKMGNYLAPPKVKIPEEEMKELKELIIGAEDGLE